MQLLRVLLLKYIITLAKISSGFMESAYHSKNGVPRQGCLVKESKGKIRILDALYNNPQHSLEGLEQYSHVW